MKSLAWIEAENAELSRAATDERAASLRRLKQRVANVLYEHPASVRKNVNAAIDAWSAAEKRTK